MNKKEQATKIIDDAATASAIAGGALAQMAFVGLDNSLIVPIVAKMVISIASLFNKPYDEAVSKVIASKVFRIAVGAGLIGKAIAGAIPLIGNAVNAAISNHLVQMIGWAIYSVLEDDKDIGKVSESEWKKYLRGNKKAGNAPNDQDD